MDFSLFKDIKEEMRNIEKRMNSVQKGMLKAIPHVAEEGEGSGAYSMAQTQVYVESSGTGREPRVYKASTLARAGPGGVKELKREVYDNTKGRQLTMGRCLGDRGHVVTRELDTAGVPVTENEDLYNLSDEEGKVKRFHREWEKKRDRYLPAMRDEKYLPMRDEKYLPSMRNEKYLPASDATGRNGKGGKYLTKK